MRSRARASLGVSSRLGYAPNGTSLLEVRGEADMQQNLLLAREDFIRPAWVAGVQGGEAVQDLLVPGPRH